MMSFNEKFPKTDEYPESLRFAFKEIWNTAQEEYKQKVKEAIKRNKMDEDELRWNGETESWNKALTLIEMILGLDK